MSQLPGQFICDYFIRGTAAAIELLNAFLLL
jgi:hypothetical protein